MSKCCTISNEARTPTKSDLKYRLDLWYLNDFITSDEWERVRKEISKGNVSGMDINYERYGFYLTIYYTTVL